MSFGDDFDMIQNTVKCKLKQLDILEKKLKIWEDDKSIEGVLLIGSVAYGTATADSDLDLIVITNRNNFESEYIDGILVEIHFATYDALLKKLDKNEQEIYKYLYSRIIIDNGKLENLIQMSKRMYENYSVPQKDFENICYWLSSTKLKLKAALNMNDETKISYLLSTNTWKMLEGVWAKNNKPMPPSSLAYQKHGCLENTPWANWFSDLLIGDVTLRAKHFISVIDWICK